MYVLPFSHSHNSFHGSDLLTNQSPYATVKSSVSWAATVSFLGAVLLMVIRDEMS